MKWRAVLTSVLLAPGVSGCVYYNRMWSAERLARQARRAEARGDEGVARTAWTQAAAKAESVHAKHPGSKWADDAWVLHAEGVARGASCAVARPVIGEALVEAVADDLRERMALVAAECALALGAPAEAARQLQLALASSDGGRRSRGAYLAGRTAQAQGDLEGAIAWYARSRERAAGPARVHALLQIGQAPAAVALMDTVARDRFVESEWSAMLAAVAARAGPTAAAEALDRLLRRARVPPAERTRLLLADADRRYAAGEFAAARDRYLEASQAGGDLPEARTARVRAVRATGALARTPADLGAVREDLARVTRTGDRGAGTEAAAFARLLQRVAPADASEAAELRGAELARDSLRAAALAGELFVAFAERHPESLFAPKALVAALPLLPERHDSLLDVLDRAYGSSPYVVALRGEISPGYAGLEDSLARALGVATRTAARSAGPTGRAPFAGPRGPWWDEVFPGSGRPGVPGDSANVPVGPPGPRPQNRPPDRGRPAPRPAERPTERPADS